MTPGHAPEDNTLMLSGTSHDLESSTHKAFMSAMDSFYDSVCFKDVVKDNKWCGP